MKVRILPHQRYDIIFLKRNEDNKIKKKKIEYWTNVPALTEIQEAKPIPFKDLEISWWKSVPSNFNNGEGRTVKNCPSFSDMFSSAYVLRMWCDSRIYKTENGFAWKTSSDKFFWQYHEDNQMLDYMPQWFGERVWSVLKPVSPWLAKTPPGYSIYQMPVMYDSNPNFVAAQGIIHTDSYHFINVPMFAFSDKEYFDIKLGTPLALHFPFKRDKFNLEIREQKKDDIYLERKSELISGSKFKNGYRFFMKKFVNE